MLEFLFQFCKVHVGTVVRDAEPFVLPPCFGTALVVFTDTGALHFFFAFGLLPLPIIAVYWVVC